MKRSLFGGLLVFLLIQSGAMAAEVPHSSQPSTHLKSDELGASVAPTLDQSRGMDRASRDQLSELMLDMLRESRIPSLVLTVVNNANVPENTVTAAKVEVEKIYRRAGVHVLWHRYEHTAQSNALHLTVVIVRNCVNKKTCQDLYAAGMALGSDGRGARWAYVFYNRIQESAEKSLPTTLLNRPNESLILGLAIAHEVGHLLLPLGHAPFGLMRSEIDMATLSETATELQFTSEQAIHIRKLLLTSEN